MMIQDESVEKMIDQDLSNSFKLKARPLVFDYLDYRLFLVDSYQYKKKNNPAFSESAFIRMAGFGATSRGYFSLIVKGKRNLTPKTIFGFSKALKLSAKEAIFFENLVSFNQAKDESQRAYYMERLEASSHGHKNKLFEVLQSQYRFVSHWHLIVLRELVALKDFIEDETWIMKKIKKKITRSEINQGIQDLINLGMLTRDHKGKLVQSNKVVTFTEDKFNFKNTINLHKQYLDMAGSFISDSRYENRSLRISTISCSKTDLEKIRQEMMDFSRMLINKYGAMDKQSVDTDTVLQLGMQLFQLTE